MTSEFALVYGGVGFWDPTAKTRTFCEEIAKGLLAMVAIIVMFSACKRRFILGPGCEDQQVWQGDRERPPDHFGGHRHVHCVQAPVGFWDPAAKTSKFCEGSRTSAWP